MSQELEIPVHRTLPWCLNLLSPLTITRLQPVLVLLLVSGSGCLRFKDDCPRGDWMYCVIVNSQDPDEDGVSPDYDCAESNATIGALYVGRDRDGDGVATTEDYGPARSCEVPDGFSDVFGDCDDSDPAKTDVRLWWPDLDGDDWGTGESAEICASEAGYALEGGDCDDAEPGVSPSAEEVADDGIDNDCDGRADDEAPQGSTTTGDATVTLDGSGDDEFSSSFAAIYDPGGRRGMDLAVGSPGAMNGAGEAVGAVDIVAGPILDAGDVEDQAFTRLWGADAQDRAGAGVAGLGDIDGDGYPDLIVGAPGVESSTGDFGGASGPEGAAYVVYSPVGPGTTIMLEDSRHVAILSASDSGGRLGTSVAGVGDLTGDGLPDFAVGAPYVGGGRWADQPEQAGKVYLLEDLPDDEQGVGDVAFTSLEGEEEYGWLGAVIAGGKDLNGDGTPDLVVGEPTDRGAMLDLDYSTNEEAGGTAWILLDPPSGTSTISPWASTWVTGAVSSGLGGAVSLLDDLDGDGLADLAFGAPMDDSGEEDGGAVYLLSGAVLEGLDPSEASASAALIGVIYGVGSDAYLGWGVADAGDLDEDGRSDLLVGAPGTDAEKGAAWLLTGAADGDQLGDASLSIGSPTPWGWAGRALGAADLNGLGRPDLLVGGVEYVYPGKATAMPGHLSLFLTDSL